MKPHYKMKDISAYFNVSDSASSAKSTYIKKLFDITQMDDEWSVPHMRQKKDELFTMIFNEFIMGMPDDELEDEPSQTIPFNSIIQKIVGRKK